MLKNSFVLYIFTETVTDIKKKITPFDRARFILQKILHGNSFFLYISAQTITDIKKSITPFDRARFILQKILQGNSFFLYISAQTITDIKKTITPFNRARFILQKILHGNSFFRYISAETITNIKKTIISLNWTRFIAWKLILPTFFNRDNTCCHQNLRLADRILCNEVRTLKTRVSWMWCKTSSDSEAQVLETWGMWSTSSLSLYRYFAKNSMKPRVAVKSPWIKYKYIYIYIYIYILYNSSILDIEHSQYYIALGSTYTHKVI